jgi:hypothetical protein
MALAVHAIKQIDCKILLYNYKLTNSDFGRTKPKRSIFSMSRSGVRDYDEAIRLKPTSETVWNGRRLDSSH